MFRKGRTARVLGTFVLSFLVVFVLLSFVGYASFREVKASLSTVGGKEAVRLWISTHLPPGERVKVTIGGNIISFPLGKDGSVDTGHLEIRGATEIHLELTKDASKGPRTCTIPIAKIPEGKPFCVSPLPRDPPLPEESRRPVSLAALEGVMDAALIQQLIDAATPGDTITVSAGIYAGPLVIEKSLTLTADGDVTLLGNGRNPVIQISGAKDVTIEGFTIAMGRCGISIERSSSVTIEVNTIRLNRGPGIRVETSEVRIHDNTIEENQSWGIVVWSGSKASITQNVIARNTSVGVIVFGHLLSYDTYDTYDTEVEIVGNQIIGNQPNALGDYGRGVEIQEAKAVVADNVIRGNPDVGLIAFGSEIQITSNQVIESRGSAGRGVELQNTRASLFGNTISRNDGIGLAVFGSTVELQENVIRENGHDVFIDADSTVTTGGGKSP